VLESQQVFVPKSSSMHEPDRANDEARLAFVVNCVVNEQRMAHNLMFAIAGGARRAT
jgi:hypothetical protein